MTEMGAPPEMVDTMASAAQDGFDSAIDSGMSPMDAFGAAGDSVDAAFGDGPPPGPMGPGDGQWDQVWVVTPMGPPGYGWRPRNGTSSRPPPPMGPMTSRYGWPPSNDMPADRVVTLLWDQPIWVVTLLQDLPIWVVSLTMGPGPPDMGAPPGSAASRVVTPICLLWDQNGR